MPQGWKAVQVHCMATARCHLFLRAHARQKPALPLHTAGSRWITHSSGQTLEKGEKKSTVVTEREEIHKSLVLPLSKNTVWQPQVGIPENRSYLIWNWSSLCETSEYSSQGMRRVILALILKVGEISSRLHSGSKPSCALHAGLHRPSIKHLKNGCRLVSSLTFSRAQISS